LDSNRGFSKDLDNVLLDGFSIPCGMLDLGFWFCFSGILVVYTNQLLNTKLIASSRPYNCMITLFYIYGKYCSHSKASYNSLGKERIDNT
jgi:hypothetical protein